MIRPITEYSGAYEYSLIYFVSWERALPRARQCLFILMVTKFRDNRLKIDFMTL